jgi:DNA-directed RNA polymerase III subunit RPC8
MFILSEIEDLVQIHPSSFRLPTLVAIEEELNRKYANRVIHELGLGIKVFQVSKVSDPIVHSCQDGSFQQKVVFTLIVFKPFEGEIILGIIKECDINSGVRVHLNFFEDIYIPPPYLIQPSEL